MQMHCICATSPSRPNCCWDDPLTTTLLFAQFMQNFGKKDRTTDELFEIYQNNFAKQQASATRLQKELKNFAACAREMQVSHFTAILDFVA